MLSNGAMPLQESIERFILSPGWGKVRRSRIGGGERSEPVSRIVFMFYDTESKSRNVLASPLGEEDHEVAKGCTRVRMIMILDVDVTAERRHYNTHRPLKGKRLTTFCASLALLQNVFAVHRRAIPQPSARRAVKLKNPWARKGPSILRTFPFTTLGPKAHPS